MAAADTAAFNASLAQIVSSNPGPLESAATTTVTNLIAQYTALNPTVDQLTSQQTKANSTEAAYQAAHPLSTIQNDPTLAKLDSNSVNISQQLLTAQGQQLALSTQINNALGGVSSAQAQDVANAATASQASAASTAQATAAANDAATKQTAIDTANQSAFPNVDKMLGVSGNTATGSSPDALTDTFTSFLGTTGIGSIIGVPSTSTLNVKSAKATKTSNTVTPKAGAAPTTPSVPDNTPLQLDSYRYGSKSLTTDGIENPRSVGERANDKDDLAYLRLTIDPSSNSTLKGFAINAYSRFFLQNWQESQQEKMQIVETFSNYYAYFFGKRPMMYRYNGILLNDLNNEWANDLVFYYENYFRGSQSTALSGIASITYDGKTVTGFFTGISMSSVAENDKLVTFSLDMLVVDHTTTRYSPDIAALITTRQQQLAAFANSVQSFITSTSSGATSSSLNEVKRLASSKVAGNKVGISAGQIPLLNITNLSQAKQAVIATSNTATGSAAAPTTVPAN